MLSKNKNIKFEHPDRIHYSSKRYYLAISMNLWKANRIFSLLFFSVSSLFIQCKSKKPSDALFVLKENTGINFENNVEDGAKENSFLFRNFYNGGGVAIGDINNDGLPDVFLTSNTGDNKLYLNKGNWQFEDITAKAGITSDSLWSTGVTFADINGDGWLDIYVCSSGHMSTGNRKNKLYINNHNLTFTESAHSYGLDISAYTTQVAFFDYDGDGDLDCFMINNSPIPVNQLDFTKRDLPEEQWPVAAFLKGGGDHLYRNDNGHFTEVTREAGIHGSLISFGLGATITDINNDGWPDIYVSNDSYERDYFYINQKDGTFKDELTSMMQHTSFSSMGSDIADINNDGYPDIFTTDMFPLNDHRLKTMGAFDNIDVFNAKIRAGFYYQYPVNALQLNNRDGMFKDIARYAGVPATDWSWGALLFDMDNDGWNDIYVCNGVNRDVTNLDFMNFFADEVYRQMVLKGQKKEIDELLKKIPRTPLPNKAFSNTGNLRFEDVTDKWGFNIPSFSNGAAYGDMDNDGALDLIVNNENQPAFVFQNNARTLTNNNYIAFSLKGKDKNTFAIGSKIQLYLGKQILTRELFPSRGFQSSMDYKLLFGIGKKDRIDSAVIIWPDRTKTLLLDPAINQTHFIRQSISNDTLYDFYREKDSSYCTKVDASFDKHIENEMIDFYKERNIPRLLSREGPKAAVGDVNGDGLEDVFIGGTPGHPGQLYLQTASGGFVKKKESVFSQFADFEDVAVLFFDCDGDGDLDLVIGPGGNEAAVNSRQLQLRLFKNDGRGNFTIDVNAFPATGMNISCIAAEDFNGDGSKDLFVGARNYPQLYGVDPESYLFQNDGKGHFTNVTATICPALKNIGMVCGAAWADITGNHAKDLVVCGEWMKPRIFEFKNNAATEIKTNLDDIYGWWQTVTVADINGDGRPDLLLGNIGENFYLCPDQHNPIKLWLNDYDQNGSLEKIMTYTVEGKDMPVFLKRDMEDQLPSIKKSNLKNGQYADKPIQDLFPDNIVRAATVKKFDYPASCIAVNLGNGRFEIRKLPMMAQLSCINVFKVLDVNGDGYPDIVFGGNQFGYLPQFERQDAFFGDVLLNDGKGNLSWMNNNISGFRLRGEVRDIALIHTKANPLIVFLQNNDEPVLYRFNLKK